VSVDYGTGVSLPIVMHSALFRWSLDSSFLALWLASCRPFAHFEIFVCGHERSGGAGDGRTQMPYSVKGTYIQYVYDDGMIHDMSYSTVYSLFRCMRKTGR
jgi:hypothetical protein